LTAEKRGVRKIILLVFWPLGFILSSTAVYFPKYVEDYYTLRFSKVVAGGLSRLTGIFSFSLAEVIVLLLLLFFIFAFFRMLIRVISRKKDEGKKKGLLSFLLNILVFLGIIYFCFMIIWGLNYQRLSFAEIAGYKTNGFSEKELEQLCDKLIVKANNLRSSLKEDEHGVMKYEGGFDGIRNLAPQAYSRAALIYPELGGKFGKPKPVFFSFLMSYTGISGIYFPFTAEANVNIDIPDCLLPATTCHEMAHQRGFAREDEANYLAWLTCNNIKNAEFNYSGTLFALIYAINALSEQNPDLTRELQKKYGEGLSKDLQAVSQYWEKYEGKAEKIATDINDTYLKSNKQEQGVRSYGRMVDLLLAEQRTKK